MKPTTPSTSILLASAMAIVADSSRAEFLPIVASEALSCSHGPMRA